MNLTHNLRGIICAAAISTVLMAQSANASIIISITEQGSDVVATGSGSANLAGLQASFSGYGAFSLLSGVHANAILGATTNASDASTFYEGVTGPTNFGPGGYFNASSGSGSNFGIDMANFGGRLWVPGGYISGSNTLSATDTWANATFASLGLTPGVYNYSWGTGDNADSLQVRIGADAGAVPELATWLMMLTGFGLLGATLRRRPKVRFSYS